MSLTYIASALRRAVYTEYANRCYICQGTTALDLHHIQPEYAAGATEPLNLAPLCSNKLGKASCHVLAHNAYRVAEKRQGGHLTREAYGRIVIALRDMTRPNQEERGGDDHAANPTG